MSLSKNLFNLIKSLTSHEKGYIKKQGLKKGATDKKYLLLFNVIDQMNNYDELLVKQKLDAAGYKGNITNTKRYLLETIALSLVHYQMKQVPKLELAHYQQMAEVMMAKKLYALSDEFLDKADKLAEKMKYTNEQLMVANNRYRLAIRTGNYDFLGQVGALYQEQLQKKISSLDDVWQLNVAQSYAVSFSSVVGSAPPEVVDQYFAYPMSLPVFDEGKELLLVNHQIYRLNILSSYYKNTKEVEKAYECIKQMVEIYKTDPAEARRIPRNYMTALINLANRSILVDKYDEMEAAIHELEELKQRTDFEIDESMKLELDTHCFELKILHLHYTQQFGKAKLLYRQVEEFVNENRDIVKPESIVIYYYFLATSLFRAGEVLKSYDIVKMLIDNHKAHARKDLLLSCHLFLFVLHVELEYMELLPHTLNSIKYHIKKGTSTYQSLTAILQFYTRITKAGFLKEAISEHGQHLIEQLKIFKNDPIEQTITENFDYEWWIEQLLKR